MAIYPVSAHEGAATDETSRAIHEVLKALLLQMHIQNALLSEAFNLDTDLLTVDVDTTEELE